MPKVRKYSRDEILAVALTGNIEKRQKMKQLTDKQVAAYAGIKSVRTYQDKIHNPDRFKWGELIRVMRYLEFPDTEILEVMKL